MIGDADDERESRERQHNEVADDFRIRMKGSQERATYLCVLAPRLIHSGHGHLPRQGAEVCDTAPSDR